jgi:NADP-dependent alcohol dehydrogenase
MNNFFYCNPTRIVFGKGAIASLSREIPTAARVLVIYGGGSIKRNTIYDQVCNALKDRPLHEYGGIQPNPCVEEIERIIPIIKRERIDFLLAIGGGSVIDATKFLALACYCEAGDPWTLMIDPKAIPQKALPIGCVLTLPASGSEMNNCCVISRKSTSEKVACTTSQIYPKFSILDPESTYSLTKENLSYGIVDAFTHVLEQYATYPTQSPLQDRQSEAILSTLIEIATEIYRGSTDYQLRATLMWCCAQAFNGIISRGVPQDWTTHTIGHELTAAYGIPHAQTLAIILPGVWESQFETKKQKLAHYARRVWGLSGDDETAAVKAIQKTEEFFASIGVSTKFSHIGFDAEKVSGELCERFKRKGTCALGENKKIGVEDVARIILSRQ